VRRFTLFHPVNHFVSRRPSRDNYLQWYLKQPAKFATTIFCIG
jgi:hypothetical protein